MEENRTKRKKDNLTYERIGLRWQAVHCVGWFVMHAVASLLRPFSIESDQTLDCARPRQDRGRQSLELRCFTNSSHHKFERCGPKLAIAVADARRVSHALSTRGFGLLCFLCCLDRGRTPPLTHHEARSNSQCSASIRASVASHLNWAPRLCCCGAAAAARISSPPPIHLI